ncbi:MAG: hypothetical protein Q8P67_25540 [archaeon]|nr:hypothetical protein [archaeon]
MTLPAWLQNGQSKLVKSLGFFGCVEAGAFRLFLLPIFFFLLLTSFRTSPLKKNIRKSKKVNSARRAHPLDHSPQAFRSLDGPTGQSLPTDVTLLPDVTSFVALREAERA